MKIVEARLKIEKDKEFPGMEVAPSTFDYFKLNRLATQVVRSTFKTKSRVQFNPMDLITEDEGEDRTKSMA